MHCVCLHVQAFLSLVTFYLLKDQSCRCWCKILQVNIVQNIAGQYLVVMLNSITIKFSGFVVVENKPLSVCILALMFYVH